MLATNDTPEMRATFLKAMRQVANSVTVVTTDGPAGRQGATVSSFCSVSADPPTLLVCLNMESRIYEAVSGNKCFCVNVLPEGSDDIAMRFAGRMDGENPDRFTGVELDETASGPAVIKTATSFKCSTQQEIQSGSHTVFIGHVEQIHSGMQNPLIYLDGKFKTIG